MSASNALVQACSTRRVAAFSSPAKRDHSTRNRASSSAGIRSACSRNVAAARLSGGRRAKSPLDRSRSSDCKT